MSHLFQKILVAGVFYVLCATTTYAQCTYTAKASGLFLSSNTFNVTGTPAGGAASCLAGPESGSNSVFIIGKGYVVTLNAAYTVGTGGSITILDGGTLVIGSGGALTLPATASNMNSLMVEEKSALVVKSGGTIQGGNLLLGSGRGSDAQTIFTIEGGGTGTGTGTVTFDRVIVNKATVTVNAGTRLNTGCNLVLLGSEVTNNGIIAVGGNLDLSKGGASNTMCGTGGIAIAGCVFGTQGDKQKIATGCGQMKACAQMRDTGCAGPLSATNAEEAECSDPFQTNSACVGTVLPVKLVLFTAAATAHQGVVLRWETALEINNASFEVERSADGRDFRRIRSVPGRGNVQSRSTYSVVDEGPLPGTSYYRLRQIDFDGTSSYSPVRSVALGRGSAQHLQVYPGRMAQEWIVNCTLPAELLTAASSVKVYDAVGRVQQVSCPADATQVGRWTIDAHALPVGIYIVRLTTSQGTFSQRISK